jgi:hypothetical protein
MATHSTHDRASYEIEIVIPIVLKIPVYIEPIVLEAPPLSPVPAQEEVSSGVEPTGTPTLETPKEPAPLLSARALRLVLLASASAVVLGLLASLSRIKICAESSCFRACSKDQRLIVPLSAQLDGMNDRFL